MKHAIIFDTLEYMDELKRSGMEQGQAEAMTKATSKALNQLMETKEVATTNDLKTLELNLQKNLNETKVELIKFMSENTWKAIGTLATFQTIILGIFGLIQYCIK